MSQLTRMISAAKQSVINSGVTDKHLFIVDDPLDGLTTMSAAAYEEGGPNIEERCRAVIWSYKDGHYDEKDVFHENGKLAAHAELCGDD